MTGLVVPVSASRRLDAAQPAGDSLSLAVDESWLQGRSAFGGLQLAYAIRAARHRVGQDLPLRSLHATFIAPVREGVPVLADATVIRAGRSVTHVRVSLRQDEDTCLECTAILGADRASSVDLPCEDPSEASPESALALPFQPGRVPNFIQHYELRWARGRPPYSGASDASATIFVRPRAQDALYDESELVAVSDVIPPPVISLLRQPAPASSMNCALELVCPDAVRGTRQWLRFEVALHAARDGYSWQSSRIHAEDGRLVAIAHQSVACFG